MYTEGLAATKILTADGIKTNVTLIFSASQALMAAKLVQHMYLHLLEELMTLSRWNVANCGNHGNLGELQHRY